MAISIIKLKEICETEILANLLFYRTMYYSAKRGLAIACRPSVCLSVCGVGASGANTLEILETNCTDITFTPRSPKAIHLLPGKHGEILGRLESNEHMTIKNLKKLGYNYSIVVKISGENKLYPA